MIGYGPEDDHFVIELTYNYGVKSYVLGKSTFVDSSENDFQFQLFFKYKSTCCMQEMTLAA